MASMKFKKVYLHDNYKVVGTLESNSNLKNYDLRIDDYYFGCKTFEKAEEKMQMICLIN